MKKNIYLALSILFLSVIGCTNLSNTPTKKAEEFLKNYQTLDNSVLTDLNEVVDNDTTLNESQKTMYKDIMKKHYQNLTYEIKEETVDGDEAIVTVEISVTDFKRVLDEANNYLNNNKDEFNDESGNFSTVKFNEYKLNQLKDAKEKVRYTIELRLTRVNDMWTVDSLDEVTFDKINGIYNY